MKEITRSFNPGKGLEGIDYLTGYIFSPESMAHKFIINRTDGEPFSGSASAWFIRADKVKVVMANPTTGNISEGGDIEITLVPECYQVPGLFLFLILHTVGGSTTCVYAASSEVLDVGAQSEIPATETTADVTEQIRQLILDYSDTISNANLVAAFAQNVGEIESSVDTFQQSVDGITAALAEADVRALNTPNLLTQDYWENNNGQIIIFGSAMRHYWTSHPFIKNLKNDTEYTYTEEPADKGDAWYREIDSVDETTGEITYKDVWHVFKDEDEIRVSLIDLGAGNEIVESDGEKYRYPLQFTVTGLESGYNNSEDLIFNHGSNGGTYEKDGQTVTYPPSGQLPMVDGETYTLSCWARITQGTDARLVFAYGYNTSHYDSYGNQKFFDITGSEWQRVVWSFVYHATSGNLTFYPRVSIGVCRKYTGVVQLCGFRLVHGGLYGSNTVDTLAAEVADLRAQVEDLKSRVVTLEA